MRVEPADIEALFDAIPDVLFFIKDLQGRYTHVNQTMLRRLGLRAQGRDRAYRGGDLPDRPRADYVDQDARVLSGEVIENLMELHLFANREPGWCLTCKRPLVVDGAIEGLIGISRDLGQKDSLAPSTSSCGWRWPISTRTTPRTCACRPCWTSPASRCPSWSAASARCSR
jgi:PAS domain-containing protein